jgi:N-acetyl-gamma-glutamyl-phosphate reductase
MLNKNELACIVMKMSPASGRSQPIRTAVVGASGFTGAELLRLAASHPRLEVGLAAASSNAGEPVGALYPHLAAAYPDMTFSHVDDALAGEVDGFDLLFFAMPHGVAMKAVPELASKVGTIVDLSADFRLKDPSLYQSYYGGPHACPELLDRAAFGIPELFRKDIAGASLVAAAGCYVTAAALCLAPLMRQELVRADWVIVDALSGVSGSGRSPSLANQFSLVNDNACAYGLIDHRHRPEMEQVIGAKVLFTPHLVPMTRGILATCYARPSGTIDSVGILDALRSFYAKESFVRVLDDPPSTKATTGSNAAHLSARFDESTGLAIVMCALDNLVKGAAGQAVQCANIALGIEEEAGLSAVGLFP